MGESTELNNAVLSEAVQRAKAVEAISNPVGFITALQKILGVDLDSSYLDEGMSVR